MDERVSVMDFNRLQELRDMDDEDLFMVRELVDVFLTKTSQRLPTLHAAIEAGDADVLVLAAHGVRGATSSVGAVAVTGLCCQLEQNAHHGMPADAVARAGLLHGLWERTHQEITTWLVCPRVT